MLSVLVQNFWHFPDVYQTSQKFSKRSTNSLNIFPAVFEKSLGPCNFRSRFGININIRTVVKLPVSESKIKFILFIIFFSNTVIFLEKLCFSRKPQFIHSITSTARTSPKLSDISNCSINRLFSRGITSHQISLYHLSPICNFGICSLAPSS